MDIFVWNDSFVTGQPVVDAEHQGLVNLINLIIEHQSTSTPPEEIDKVLVQLIQYAVTHFQHEEELMASTGCDPRFIEIHRNVHADFGQQVVKMRAMPSDRASRPAHWGARSSRSVSAPRTISASRASAASCPRW